MMYFLDFHFAIASYKDITGLAPDLSSSKQSIVKLQAQRPSLRAHRAELHTGMSDRDGGRPERPVRLFPCSRKNSRVQQPRSAGTVCCNTVLLGVVLQVFCGNFEYDAPEKAIMDLFEKHGRVHRIDMKTGEHPSTAQRTERPRGPPQPVKIGNTQDKGCSIRGQAAAAAAASMSTGSTRLLLHKLATPSGN